MQSHPIERFDPLLRELARFGLVVRDDSSGELPWHLTDEAQARLVEISVRNVKPVVPEKLVYMNHLCSDCQRRGLTRLNGGRYLCDSCSTKPVTEPETLVAPSATAS